MDIDELKKMVSESIEFDLTMDEQVSFSNFCKEKVNELFSSYIEELHEKVSNSNDSMEREMYYKEIHHIGRKKNQLR